MKNKENRSGVCDGEQTEKKLPSDFLKKMQSLLGEEAASFFESYDRERLFGLRINPLKGGKEFPKELFGLKKIPWSREGYYYDQDMRPGRHPFHEAGVYYIQEPSAQACVEALDPGPGERVLDLCAAPGGKTTHIAGRMEQRGLLVCNEIHPARAKILSQNVERMGIANAVVTNMEPGGLVSVFPEFFDKIVVDAPCSGEGMFRKDEDARKEWSLDHVTMCAERQDEILDCAVRMLKKGGRILYSTCTFSPEENERTAARFLERHPEFSILRPDCARFFSEGRPEWAENLEEVRNTVRIWPHKADGEGHFMALFANEGSERGEAPEEKEKGKDKGKDRGKDKEKDKEKGKGREKGKKTQAELKDFEEFCRENLTDSKRLLEGKKFLTFGDQLYLAPEETPELSGIKTLRPGLHVGTLKKGRLEPSHGLALFLKKEEALRSVELGTGRLAEKYLRGESISLLEAEQETGEKISSDLKGWTLLTSGGFTLGFGKTDRGIIKNHYPKGLRRP